MASKAQTVRLIVRRVQNASPNYRESKWDTPEHALWFNVFASAAHEAIQTPITNLSGPTREELQRRAAQYLLFPSAVYMIGLDPEWVAAQVRQIVEYQHGDEA